MQLHLMPAVKNRFTDLPGFLNPEVQRTQGLHKKGHPESKPIGNVHNQRNTVRLLIEMAEYSAVAAHRFQGRVLESAADTVLCVNCQKNIDFMQECNPYFS